MTQIDIQIPIDINQVGQKIEVTQAMVEEGLYEICDSVHSHCNNECPVFEANHGVAPGSDKPFEENRGCDCFKSGSAMLKFLQENV